MKEKKDIFVKSMVTLKTEIMKANTTQTLENQSLKVKNNMKTTFKVFGLKEEEIIRNVFLHNELILDKELAVTRHHQIDFDNEFDAMEFIRQTQDVFEHGFEIVKTFNK